MGLLINFNGTLATEATVSVLDRSFLYGDSVYEVIRTIGGRHFALQEHLDRLRASAAYLYMDVPWSDSEIIAEVERTLEAAGNPESYIRVMVTRGAEEEISLLPQPETTPDLIVIVRPLSSELQLIHQGVHLAVVPRLRNDPEAFAPAAKTGNYLNNILALIEARRAGANDAVLLNRQGKVTEATTSNLWIVRDGVVLTPTVEAGILHGITRRFLLDILVELDIPHAETELTRDDLYSAEEAFLSSTIRIVVPVSRFDDHVLPECPGPVTRRLWDAFIAFMRSAVAPAAVARV